ncbi:GTPase IMAP family member 9-like [Clinocottus analis]|uniref:GTPase IMAP family member 9-like n=1 Tax=Clinocottus analis TaxID=304258 RepID=UPI0035C0953A
MARNLGSSRTNDKEVRIVMLGKTGIGKSATGNTILGRDCFVSKCSGKSMTVDCSKGKTTVDGQQVAVIDTPGLFDTRFGMEKTTIDLTQCICYSAPGPHVFLVVIGLGRYTEEEKQTVKKIQEIFGQAADRYSMVLFTHGDNLDDTIENFLKDCPDLKGLVDRCSGQYHVFNNKEKENRSQVTELLLKIRDVVQKNGGSHYTNDMFQEAERSLREEVQRTLEENEEKIRKEKEELERKLQAKFEKEEQKLNERLQIERERDMKEREEEKKREREYLEEERKREREEREAERKRDREEKDNMMTTMNAQLQAEREMEREERREEKKREREWRNEEKKREKEEREAERKRHREEKEQLIANEMKAMKEKHQREVKAGIEQVQSKHEDQAREKAEQFNPFRPVIKVLTVLGNKIGSWLK